ncbi:MAG TPA: radical SAM protein [candidate division Zixibacteria bacterium]|nr:radical SAM protein [candidate division Zixibacteria bacterium]
MSFLYGPVPSRRLGRSLGVDILSGKSCTIDCIYCQLGSSPPKKPVRRRFVDPEEVELELSKRVNSGVETDYITFSGSGEPTLSEDLGRLIAFAKGLNVAPVCVLTNGTLLWDEDVRAELAMADVVIPNLDAADEETFRKINRPHEDLCWGRIIDGLMKFRGEFSGKLLLEIVLIEGANDSDEHLARLSELVKRISPDGVWVGTVHRPPAESWAKPVPPERLERAREIIGESAHIIESFQARDITAKYSRLIDEVMDLLRRRPETSEGMAKSLGANEHEVAKALSILEHEGKVERTEAGYYRVKK